MVERETSRPALPAAGGITVVEAGTDDLHWLVPAVGRLLPQLSSSAAPPSPEALAAVVSSGANHLLVARARASAQERASAGEVAGMLVLVVFPLPSGARALVEDVVVAQEWRRRGVGATLMAHAVQLACDLGARTVDLTSRPSRDAANRMYVKLGFSRRETNVYRMTCGPG